MSRRLFHMIMAVLGLCSGTACTSDADEYVQTSEQQSSGFVAPSRSAVIDHGTTYSYQTEEVWCQRGDNRIYGVAYMPEGIQGRMPMVIYSHGTADNIAPISYSERMVERYASAELKRIEGAGHGFYGQQQTQAIDWMLDFLNAEEQKAAAEDEPQDDGADANVISDDTTGIKPVKM